MEAAADGQVQSEWNLRVGSSFRKQYVWKTGPEGAQLPVDLTGWTGMCHLLAKPADETPLMIISTENAKMVLGADGSINIDIPYAETLVLAPFKKVYGDIEITQTSTNYRRNLIGITVNVLPQRTKP